jgi:signal transduction histidine kinase
MEKMNRQHQFITELNATGMVYADRVRIEQVVTNLLTNAIKYSPGQYKVLVRTASDEEKITVSVVDHGVGIDRSQQEKVFERFYRVNDVSASISPGIGLGLFLCREIITRHGGNIWLKSQKNKGSTFFFTLPVKT